MNAAALQTAGVIVGLLVSVITVYYLIRSNAREQLRQREQERDKAVTDARAPLIADNVRLDGVITALRLELQRKDDRYAAETQARDTRITQLEDLLWKRDRGGNS